MQRHSVHVDLRFSGFGAVFTALEETLNEVLAAAFVRGAELCAFNYRDKVAILYACWPLPADEARRICDALLRFDRVNTAIQGGKPALVIEREMMRLRQSFGAIGLIGVDQNAGFRVIAANLSELLSIAADQWVPDPAADAAAARRARFR